jgi:hypothetical protein
VGPEDGDAGLGGVNRNDLHRLGPSGGGQKLSAKREFGDVLGEVPGPFLRAPFEGVLYNSLAELDRRKCGSGKAAATAGRAK